MWVNVFLVMLYFMAALALAALAGLAWRSRWLERRQNGMYWLLAFNGVAAVYSLLFAAELVAIEPAWVSLFFRWRQAVFTVLPPLGLLFIVSAMGLAKQLTPLGWLVLSVHPLLVGTLMLTNAWHQLLWYEHGMKQVSTFTVMDMEPTGWFAVHTTYVAGLSVLVLVLSGVAWMRLPPGQRPQVYPLMLGTLIPVLTGLVSSFTPLGSAPFWLGPPSLVLMGWLWLWGMRQYRLFGFMPVAQETLVASLPEAVVVTDETGQLMDFNANAARLLDLTPAMLGQPAYLVLASHPNLLNVLGRSAHTRLELNAHRLVYVEARTIPLLNQRQMLLGWLTTLWDITASVQAVATRDALIAIAQAAATADSLSTLFVALHTNVQKLMPARNFYIALYDAENESIHFPYVVDEFEQPELTPRPLQHGLTEYVLRTRQPLLATPEVFAHLRATGEVDDVGTPSIDWLGVPLLVGDQAIGVVAVQTYTPGLRYGANERDLLTFVANQLALVVEHKRAEEARRNRARYLAELNAITQAALMPADNFADTLALTIERLGRLFKATGAILLTHDANHRHFTVQVAWGEHAELFRQLPPLPDAAWLAHLWAGHPLPITFTGLADLPPPTGTWHPWEHAFQQVVPHYALLILPLMADNARQGLLMLVFPQPHRFTAEDRERAQQVANQLALAIAKAHALVIARQHAHEAEILHQALQVVNAATTPTEAGQRVLEQLARVVPYHAASVQLRVGDDLQLIGWRGQALATPLASALPLHRAALNRVVLETKASLNIPDVREDPRFVVFSDADLAVRAWLGVPLLANATAIGLLTLDHHQPGFFTADHARQAQTFASQVALAIDKARLIDMLQQQTEELAALYQASGQLLELGDTLANTASALAEMLCRNFGISHCAVFWLEPTTQALTYLAQAGPRAITYPQQWPATAHPVTLLEVARTGHAQVEHDVRANPEALIFDPTMRARLVLPLKTQARVVGVLNLEHLTPYAFDEARVRMLTNLAEQAGLALNNVSLIEQLQSARRAAQEASDLKSSLLANTSHELRTPLTGILGSLNLVLSGLCASPEEETMFTRLAYQSAERLMTLINDLLDLSKIEAGRMEFDLQPANLTLIAREAQITFAAQAKARGLVLELLLPDNRDVWVWADPLKTSQILTNLVGNALKFTEHGRVMLMLDAMPEVNQARLVVRDTGIGIAPDVQARLFQPFVQADGSATRKYGGTGLGLSISRQLAEHMGGQLALHSAGLGHGTTLTLNLPLHDPALGDDTLAR